MIEADRAARTPYTEAWCSRDPARVAAHYVPGGMSAIKGGDAAGIAEVAEPFIAAFPDIEVFMDDLVPPGGRRRRIPLDLHAGSSTAPARWPSAAQASSGNAGAALPL